MFYSTYPTSRKGTPPIPRPLMARRRRGVAAVFGLD